MAGDAAPAILCLASYFKGGDFLRACKRQGWYVILLTVSDLAGAEWPRESIDELHHMPDLSRLDDVIGGVSYLARSRAIDRLIALDDYDVETVAALREHLRLPGMSASAARYLRDKLAMRLAAREHGIPVPAFVHVLNHDSIRAYTASVPSPWVLKPRSEVSSIGIARIESAEELWPRIEGLGDRQSFYLLERYVPGAVYHVDAIVEGGETVFAQAHRYGRPPMDVYHGGGMFVTQTVRHGSPDEAALLALHRQVIAALGYRRGALHTEFIKGDDDGQFYFLETGARVGGAYISSLVEAATGLNLWSEWARLELAGAEQPYQVPAHGDDYAGLVISLARQEYPDTAAYDDPEIVWRLDKRHHVGLGVASSDHDRVAALLDAYVRRIAADFAAHLPPHMSRPPSAP